jgi:hypothetical protein
VSATTFTGPERKLIVQYGRVRRRVEPLGEEVSLGPEGGDRHTGKSATEILDEWTSTYPTLAATGVHAERIPTLYAAVLETLEGLPPCPKGKLTEPEAAALREAVRPVKNMVSMFQQFVYGVAALRSVVSAGGEVDSAPLDPYAIVGEMMTTASYRNFDRIATKLYRLTPEGKRQVAKYNAKATSIARRAAWLKEKRAADPEYLDHENARRRQRYAERKRYEKVAAEVLTALDAEARS